MKVHLWMALLYSEVSNMELKMNKCTDQRPPYEEGLRVLIYTEGCDFAGEQFFDVPAIDLYPPSHPDEAWPEVCEAATHWIERPHVAV